MFELTLQGTRSWRCQPVPGVYCVQLPEMNEQQGRLVDQVLQRLDGALHVTGVQNQLLLPQNGGLISNLRLWENIVLPRWYHAPPLADADEQLLLQVLAQLLPETSDARQWLHRSPGAVTLEERALAGLLRCLLAPARCVWLEADWQLSVAQPLFERSARLLAEWAQVQQRLVLIFAADAQAFHAMPAWSAVAPKLEWTPV